jgi:putative hemolysin
MQRDVTASEAAHDYSGEGRKSVSVKVYLDEVEVAGARAYVQLKLKEEPAPKAAELIAVSQDRMAWAAAKAFCQRQGGKLPRVNDNDSWDVASQSLFGSMLGGNRIKIDDFGVLGDPWPAGLPGSLWTGTSGRDDIGRAMPLFFYESDGKIHCCGGAEGKMEFPAVCVP